MVIFQVVYIITISQHSKRGEIVHTLLICDCAGGHFNYLAKILTLYTTCCMQGRNYTRQYKMKIVCLVVKQVSQNTVHFITAYFYELVNSTSFHLSMDQRYLH